MCFCGYNEMKTIILHAIYAIIILAIIYFSYDLGKFEGMKHPNIATIGLDDEEQFKSLQKRCKDLAEVERFTDVVMSVLATERMLESLPVQPESVEP